MADATEFDAIVVGSGITGGWSAKELCEAGLKVLMIERGRPIEHQSGYTTETAAPWELPYRGLGDPAQLEREQPVQRKLWQVNEWNQQYFVNDRENPYQTAGAPFTWFRSYQLGGRSLVWGRQSFRWSDYDFGANKADGHGTDWPVRYADMDRWYSHVESFIGVSGTREGLPQLPDGEFQPPIPLNAAETRVKAAVERAFPGRKMIPGRPANLTRKIGDRGPCQYRGICSRGCSYGAYFSTQSSTLPAARATGNLTLLTDTAVESIVFDPTTNRVTGVQTIDANTKARRSFTARMVFVNAGAFNSVALLLRSRSERFVNGLANSSGVLGRYIMDHAVAMAARAIVPGIADRTYYGNRPNNAIIPRFRNIGDDKAPFLRGYAYQGGAVRRGWRRGGDMAGTGDALKDTLGEPGDWVLSLTAFAETLPYAENRITLDKAVDSLGLPQLKIAFDFRENEYAALRDAETEARRMLEAAGARVIASSHQPGAGGTSVHEMGGARMGNDPATSVLNEYNQAHDAPNLFVTDGAAMSSSACQNPSLTYMALTARACANAVSMLKEGRL
ncbi:GMC family oxidoreductase [Sphingomonas sp.]|uniref:FAD-dependent oxidoreductase n=1 Tax=Sphingomonas sp. TaxID=28214 RepID=UPI0017E277B7|nr:GMC family oxidoreductase [Sphingomonas sp.]MBA4761783.1 GMC family oxidoreductase [Sphingomonas sp.]